MTEKDKIILKEIRSKLQEVSVLLEALMNSEEGAKLTQNGEKNLKTEAELLKIVTSYLRRLGIPANIKGYCYLREAIIMVIKDVEVLNSITKVIYPEIAKTHQTTPIRVERNMRNAIEVAWTKGDTKILEELFGYKTSTSKRKLTNSEFIGLMADEICLKIQ